MVTWSCLLLLLHALLRISQYVFGFEVLRFLRFRCKYVVYFLRASIKVLLKVLLAFFRSFFILARVLVFTFVFCFVELFSLHFTVFVEPWFAL